MIGDKWHTKIDAINKYGNDMSKGSIEHVDRLYDIQFLKDFADGDSSFEMTNRFNPLEDHL